MKVLRWLWSWLRRIPSRFTVVFLLLLTVFLAALTALLDAAGVAGLVDRIVGSGRGTGGMAALAARLAAAGLAVAALAAGALLASYNLAALVYRRIRARPSIHVHPPADGTPGDGHRLDEFERIGIILAGGGAKGAYQAGALKAIHEFLEEHDALGRVEMIAGTSIGAWNAMFWLAGLVKPPEGRERSAHEVWWREISLGRIVEFDTYLPARTNHFLRSAPWEESFRDLFVEPEAVRRRLARLFPSPGASGADGDPPVHFYLTRSNVELGQLEFATNYAGLRKRTRPRLGAGDAEAVEPLVEPDRFEVIAGGDLERALDRTRRAVFASMDLPPLFPYRKIRVNRTEWFEDGGVIDNLPIRFGTGIERCDLLFVLPLNASFAEPVDHDSVTRRLFRVMDVRQGVMERTSLKMVYLYNELAALRREAADRGECQPEARLERTAMRREHEPVSIFSIVPEAPLAVGTAEFWKSGAAGEAFDLLYAATRNELRENFEEDTDPGWIRMTRVSPVGERTHFDDF